MQSLVVSFLCPLFSILKLEAYCLIKYFDQHVSSISNEELVLPCHACVFFVCNEHSLLLTLLFFRIDRIENPSCSACKHSSLDRSHLIYTIQLWNFCITHSLVTLCLSTTSDPGAGELPGFCDSVVICHTPISRKGSGNNKNKCLTTYR